MAARIASVSTTAGATGIGNDGARPVSRSPARDPAALLRSRQVTLAPFPPRPRRSLLRRPIDPHARGQPQIIWKPPDRPQGRLPASFGNHHTPCGMFHAACPLRCAPRRAPRCPVLAQIGTRGVKCGLSQATSGPIDRHRHVPWRHGRPQRKGRKTARRSRAALWLPSRLAAQPQRLPQRRDRPRCFSHISLRSPSRRRRPGNAGAPSPTRPMRSTRGHARLQLAPAKSSAVRREALREIPATPPPQAGVSGLSSGLEHLAALVHAGLQIDMVWAPQLAGILVLDIGRPLERIGGAPHAAPGGRCFSFRDSHDGSPLRCWADGGMYGRPGL